MRGDIAGEPFFVAKEWFPRAPSKKAVREKMDRYPIHFLTVLLGT